MGYPMTAATIAPDPPRTAWQILREMIERAWTTLCFVLCVGLLILMV
jgi:hypothetical protein